MLSKGYVHVYCIVHTYSVQIALGHLKRAHDFVLFSSVRSRGSICRVAYEDNRFHGIEIDIVVCTTSSRDGITEYSVFRFPKKSIKGSNLSKRQGYGEIITIPR